MSFPTKETSIGLPEPTSSESPPAHRGSCFSVFLAACLAIGLLGAMLTLLAMTLGVFAMPLAIISGLFLVIGLQYLVWRLLGLFVPKGSDIDRKSPK